jgi:tight adherence protein B
MAPFDSPLALLGIALGAICAMLLSVHLMQSAHRLIRQAGARTRLTSGRQGSLSAMLIDDLCRNGVLLARPLSGLLMRLPAVRRLCASLAEGLREKSPCAQPRSVCELLAAVSLLAALLVLIMAANGVLAVMAAIAPWLFLSARTTKSSQKSSGLIREQLPDAISAIGMCFSAGFTIQQALALTAAETPEPLGGHLRQCAHDIEVGTAVCDALAALAKRVDCPDMNYLVIALDIQHVTGGSLKDILDGAAASIKESFELSRSLEVQTAQARLSARVVSVMPFILFAILSVIMDGYLGTFFGSLPGFMLFVFSMALEAAGILMIRRFLKLGLG